MPMQMYFSRVVQAQIFARIQSSHRTICPVPPFSVCELCLVTQEDVSRKKTDEMKKRAIHTAANYDEFRHMVSCAQLTPVT